MAARLRARRLAAALAGAAAAGLAGMGPALAQARGKTCEIGYGTCFALRPDHPAHGFAFFSLVAVLVGFLAACTGLAKARERGITLKAYGGHWGQQLAAFGRDPAVRRIERGLVFGGVAACVLGAAAFAVLFAEFGEYQ